MIRPRYRLNEAITANIFGKPGDGPLSHLGGGRRLRSPGRRGGDSSSSFRLGPRRSRAGRSTPSWHGHSSGLPGTVVASARPELHSLAVRNLLRGKALGLPSGQAVATAVGATPLTNGQLGLSGPRWEAQAPLWFYILKEAARQPQNGRRLGPVGGLIVAEVLLGLLKHDSTSFVNADTPWKPLRPIAPAAGKFGIVDLLEFAGVA
jgi:hypothetical protein